MRAFLFVLLLVTSGCVGNRQVLKGLVKDRLTGSPVDGALVVVEGVGQTTTTGGGLYNLEVKRSKDPRAVYVEARGYFKFSEFRVFDSKSEEEDEEDRPVIVLNVELMAIDDIKGRDAEPGGPRWRPGREGF